MSSTQKSPRIAVVLGSGGIRCIASIGLLKALHCEQIVPDIIVSSGGGSLFGAVFAIGEHPDEIEALSSKCGKKRNFEILNISIFSKCSSRNFYDLMNPSG